MPPDVPWATWLPSPNTSPRPRDAPFGRVDTVVLHATGGPPDISDEQRLWASINWLRSESSGVSAHYALATDGRLFQLVAESEMAWHAGTSKMPPPDNRSDVNRFSIGIELVNDNTGNDPYPPAQVDALVRLLKDIVRRQEIPRKNIVTHREIAPQRKSDPAGLDVAGVIRRVYDEGVPPESPEFRENRALIGLHARNDDTFTQTDYHIIRTARIEGLKTLSFLKDEVYERCLDINPDMEFIVRLYKHMSGGPPAPQSFANEFRGVIDRLHRKFGIVKFEIHNEPNHLTGLEGWGQSQQDARRFNEWYKQVFALLKERHPFALFGFPGLAVPHNDLEWLDWCRDSIDMSDWLGCHIYWQTPPNNSETYKQEAWGLRFRKYHEKFPHKLIEITEFGNSNGQSGLPLSEEEKAKQYVWWYNHIQQYPYIGSAHSFIATSPDPTWVNQLFTWGDVNARRVFLVAEAVGSQVKRAELPPDWGVAWSGFSPGNTMKPGDTEIVGGIIANTGRRPWRKVGDTRLILIQRWLTPGYEEVTARNYLLLPHDMAPSETSHMRVKLTAPRDEGSYLLRFDLYDVGNSEWLTAYGTEPLIHRVKITPQAEERPALRAEWIEHSVPERVTTDESFRFSVTVRNRGSRTWRAGGEPPKGIIHLGYHWITPDGREIEGKKRGVLPNNVAPGDTVTLRNLTIEVPNQAGSYTLRLDMVSEFEAWFRQVGGTPLMTNVRVEQPALRVAWVESQVPDSVTIGEPFQFSVTVRNTGSRTWRAGDVPSGDSAEQGVIHLGYHWITPDGREIEGKKRGVLPKNVAPGETAAFRNVTIEAPDQAGSYTLRLDMVSEFEAWFRQVGGTPLSIDVTVEKPAVPALAFEWIEVDVPRAEGVPAGTTVQGSVRLRNTGSEGWVAERPDGRGIVRFGYRWFDINGKRVQSVADIRTSLPRDVAPGEAVTLDPVEIAVPPVPGAYGLVLDLVKEGVAWFDHPPREPGAFTVRVTEPGVEEPETPYAVEYVANTVPAQMQVGQELAVSLTLRNASDRVWQTDDTMPIHLARHWITSDGHVDNWLDDFRIRLPGRVPPGETIQVSEVKLHAPQTPGDYTLRWDLVEENVTWFSAHGSPPLEIPIQVDQTPEPAEWRVTWLADETPSTLTVGATPRVGLRFKNTGTKTWPAGGSAPVRIGYHWYDQNGEPVPALEDLRTRLPEDVAPGDEVALGVALATPERAGEYTLAWDLVHEGVAWFEELDNEPQRIPVTVTALEAPPKEWRVRASHNEAEAARAIDNRTDTYWDSGDPQAPGMFFEIDLQEALVLDGITFRSPGRGYPAAYRVKVSRDGQRWKTVDSVAHNWKDVSVSFDARPVRYILIEQTGQTEWGATWRIGEVEIREALAWTATASHNAEEASRAIDRDPETFWSSTVSQVPGLWFQVDMGKERLIDTVIATSPGRGFPLGYRVLLSTDGTEWQKVTERTHNWTDVRALFAPTTARYLRIEQTRRIAYEAPWLISEISTHEARRHWRATASHALEQAGAAIDNDGATAWSSGERQAAGMWFMVDLGDMELVRGIALSTGARPDAMPRSFRIQTSHDGEQWRTVYETSDNEQQVDVTFEQGVTARYVTVQLTGSADHPWVINEFYVDRNR